MKCSVIVPTYNRLPSLKRTLESLLLQDFPGTEIIVVDDGSTDGTAGYLDDVKQTTKVAVIHQENQGPAMARNAGIREAKGEIIAFTDDDCIVPVDWVSRFIKVFADPGVGFAGGMAENKIEGCFASQFSQEITNHLVCFHGANGRSTSLLTSNNIAYRSHVLRGANGFDSCFRRPGGEERTLNQRLLSSGIRGVFIPGIIIEHYHVMNLQGYFRQQRNYGRGAYIFYKVIGPTLKNPPAIVSAVPACLDLVKKWLRKNPLKGMFKIIIFIAAHMQILAGYALEFCAQHTKRKR